ncbi:DUF6146 family protein [Lacinutrix iliipiscaria]|uniref:DUF6146 family protein n=1 Tax=Lacinutrix iliipiscaria TaxID=1230532 RepID=A0ABW5WMZ3_9FLAO
MKSVFYSLLVGLLLIACNTSKNKSTTETSHAIQKNDTVRISNNDLEYDIIIIEPGFSTWLASRAKPVGFHSQNYLENKNIQYVTAWNARAINSMQYDPNLYDMQINYQQGVDYGYDVNYKLYNYFIYFQIKYKQQLAGIVPKL